MSVFAITEASRIKYRGGPVQYEPELYLIYWGKHWEEEENVQLHETLNLLYHNLPAEKVEYPGTTASWEGILNQYFSNKKGPHHAARLMIEGTINSVPFVKELKQAELEKTVDEAIESFKTVNKLTPSQNAQFIVLPAPGSTYSEEVLPKEEKDGKVFVTCGFHKPTAKKFTGEHAEETYTYTLVAFAGDSGCTNKQLLEKREELKLTKREVEEQSTVVTASHEFAESVTDPKTTRS